VISFFLRNQGCFLELVRVGRFCWRLPSLLQGCPWLALQKDLGPSTVKASHLANFPRGTERSLIFSFYTQSGTELAKGQPANELELGSS
jgi:hypothetical protein